MDPVENAFPTLKLIGQRFENVWFCQDDWTTQASIWEL